MSITASLIAGFMSASMSLSAVGATGAPTEDALAPNMSAASVEWAQSDAPGHADQDEVEALAAEIRRAHSTLRVGQSRILRVDGGNVRLTMTEAGLALAPLGPPAHASNGSGGVTAMGFCHSAAMAAVYAIGSAVLAAVALSGGIVIMGVFVNPYAASAMSIALAGGSGLSALVSTYIC